MEYEARTIKWYWVLLLVVYCIAAVYFLLKANPYLYSQGTLQSQYAMKSTEKLEPWPPVNAQFELEQKASGEGHPWPFLSFGNLNMTSPEVTRNKSYTEFKAYPLKAEISADAQIIHQSQNSVILRDEKNWIYAFDNKGELVWKYGLKEEDELIQSLNDSTLLYLIKKDGSITTLSLKDGRPQWNLYSDQNIRGEAWLEDSFLTLPVERVAIASEKKSKKTTSLLRIDRNNGTLMATLEGFDFKEPFKEMLLPGTNIRLIYAANHILAINKDIEDSVKVLWNVNLPEEISRHLVYADSRIFAITSAKRLYVLNAKKKGDVEFETDLDVTPGGDVTYLPEMERLAYLGENGVLRVVDLKKEEMAWKFDLSVQGPLRDIWSSRLKGAYIQEFGMKWVYKGWTLWSPCRAQAFCVYNPDRGQLIQRIELSGVPVSLPVVLNERIFALIKNAEGKLAVAHLLEPAELRAAEAAEEAAKEEAADQEAEGTQQEPQVED